MRVGVNKMDKEKFIDYMMDTLDEGDGYYQSKIRSIDKFTDWDDPEKSGLIIKLDDGSKFKIEISEVKIQ